MPLWIREPSPSYATASAGQVALRILADRYRGAEAAAFIGPRAGGDASVGTPAVDSTRPGQGTSVGGGEGQSLGFERGRSLQRGSVVELTGFQASAVRRAERILGERRGVLVADSVGLGKTYIALALIERALRSGGRVAVFTPAALRREWTKELRRLLRGSPAAATYGLGSNAPGARPFVAWLSHERLSRGTYPRTLLDALDLVVVDEAHAFRSPSTRRYRALAGLVRGARVVLLTATPVNNSVWDLYFQLRLFAGDGAFRDIGVPDLRQAFRAAAGEASAVTSPSLEPVLREVVIRRTRPFLRERYDDVRLRGHPGRLAFPRRAPSIPIRYALEGTIEVDAIVAALEAFTWAALCPDRYRAGRAFAEGSASLDPDGVAALVRAGLLKRLESSVASFVASVRRQLRFHDAFLRALDRGRLLAPTDHRTLYGGGDGDPLQLVLEEIALTPVPPGTDPVRLRADAASDRARLVHLLERVDGRADAKLLRLISLLDHELRGCKVVLFTEYRDTARYLWRALVRRGHVALVDGAGAFLGDRSTSRRGVIDRFAPRANRVRPPPDRERVDLLIATDVLAEGLNLQDADRLVSYDLPWNPVRLIQRVGRIDRIGSPHAIVYAYPFLPDHGLERALRLLDRLRGKLTAIARTVGHEAAVLDEHANAHGSYRGLIERLAAGDADALDAIERTDAAPFELEERLQAAYDDAVAAHRPDCEVGTLREADMRRASKPGQHPVAACVPAAPGTPLRVLVAHRIGHRPHWAVVTFESSDSARPHAAEDFAAAAEILLAVLEQNVARIDGAGAGEPRVDHREPRPLGAEPCAPAAESNSAAPDQCLPCTSTLRRALDAVRPLVAERVAMLEAETDPLPRTAAGASAARALLAALTAVPGGPDASLCDRADRALATLAYRHDAGTETAIRAAITAAARTPAEAGRAHALLDALERILPSDAGTTATSQAGPTPAPSPRSAAHIPVALIGIIEARPISARGIATGATG